MYILLIASMILSLNSPISSDVKIGGIYSSLSLCENYKNSYPSNSAYCLKVENTY